MPVHDIGVDPLGHGPEPCDASRDVERIRGKDRRSDMHDPSGNWRSAFSRYTASCVRGQSVAPVLLGHIFWSKRTRSLRDRGRRTTSRRLDTVGARVSPAFPGYLVRDLRTTTLPRHNAVGARVSPAFPGYLVRDLRTTTLPRHNAVGARVSPAYLNLSCHTNSPPR